jgi:predicted ATPase
MGVLYQVSDEAKKNEIVALKMVRLDVSSADRSDSVRRFQREFQVLTQLRHPNLVSVYDYGITTAGELYFTMEWIEGQDLESRLRSISPSVTVSIIIQICRALAYLHARGVIHGDLKPANVLMIGDQVKIVDFGLALEVRSSESKVRYHTKGYSAPEVHQLRPVDYRADLYSLGATWYALLMKEPPLFMFDAERVVRLSLYEALETQSEIPVTISAVIARLMATAPAGRYISANEVITAVSEVTGEAYALETRETASSYALRTHFVDREAELEVLRTTWVQSRSGEGKQVLISGEIGVGKSRLVEEVEVQAELEGARVVWGQCIESGGSAYHPWREVLRVLARYVESTGEEVIKQVGPVLATLLPGLWEWDYMAGLAPPAELESQAAQLRLNIAIAQLLRVAAESRPTVVVIEDAQWADEATLEMLRFLARVPMLTGLLVCITYRSSEVSADHPLVTLSGRQVQRIEVKQLSPKFTTDLARSMLGLEELPSLLTERLQQTTGGNALFVQELIRSLAVEGEVLHRTVEGWQIDGKALQKAQLPESIRQVVWRRVGQLSQEGQQILQRAAVTGMVFWENAVAEAARMTQMEVRAALREGLEQELVVRRDESSFAGELEYLFNVPMVREAAYESIPQGERQEIHKQVAAWLMARSDEETNEQLGLIADHLERAGQTEQAVDYLQRAGEQAAAQFAHAEAVAYFSRALDLTPDDEQARQYALLMAREKVYDVQGAREEQKRDLATLQRLAQALADDTPLPAGGSRQAEVGLRQAHYDETIGNYPAAIAAAQEAIRLSQAVGDVDNEAAGYLQWGMALWHQGEYQAAQLRFEQALSLARTEGLRQVEADGLSSLGLVAWTQGDYDGARECSEQALPIYRELGNRQGEGRVLNSLGIVLIEQGNYAESNTYYEQALQTVREIGDRRRESYVLGNIANAFVMKGNYVQARIHFEQSMYIACEIGDRHSEGAARNNLSWTFHLLGDDEAACEHGRQSLLILREIGNRRNEGYALTNLGHALTGLGNLKEAAESYQQALALRHELGQHNLAMESLAGLARVSLAQGDLEQAQTQVKEILAYLETETLDGTEEPFRVYLTCYRVLCTNQDPRAKTILNTAYHLLQEQVAKISDEETRRSFLENVAAHREIVSEWRKGCDE